MKKTEINIREANARWSRLLKRVEAGEEITISRAGVPIARMVPVEPSPQKRKPGFYGGSIRIANDFDMPPRTPARPLGMDRGKVWIADDFDAPLSDDILVGFLGTKSKSKISRKQ